MRHSSVHKLNDECECVCVARLRENDNLIIHSDACAVCYAALSRRTVVFIVTFCP